MSSHSHRRARGASPATPRSDAVVLRTLATLATHPVLTVESAATQHGMSTAAAHCGLIELAKASILGRTTTRASSSAGPQIAVLSSWP